MSIFCARGDRASGAGEREPQALDVAAGKDHRRVKADDGEAAGDVEDDLHDVLADIGFGVIELCGVIPGESCAVVAVIHEAGGIVAGEVAQAKDDGGIRLVVVVVFDFDFYA